MNEKRLASLYELQTVYSLEDLYDFLEMIEVQNALVDDINKNSKGH